MTGEAHTYLTTRELADLLRIKERKVYDLVRKGEIPCSNRAGKWVIPKAGPFSTLVCSHWKAAH